MIPFFISLGTCSHWLPIFWQCCEIIVRNVISHNVVIKCISVSNKMWMRANQCMLLFLHIKPNCFKPSSCFFVGGRCSFLVSVNFWLIPMLLRKQFWWNKTLKLLQYFDHCVETNNYCSTCFFTCSQIVKLLDSLECTQGLCKYNEVNKMSIPPLVIFLTSPYVT